MAIPTSPREMPGIVWAFARGNGNVAFVLDSKDTITSGNSEYAKLIATLKPADRSKRYWVFVMPETYHDFNGGTYRITIAAAAQVKSEGHDVFNFLDTRDCAIKRYERIAKTDCGKQKVKTGTERIKHIGKED